MFCLFDRWVNIHIIYFVRCTCGDDTIAGFSCGCVYIVCILSYSGVNRYNAISKGIVKEWVRTNKLVEKRLISSVSGGRKRHHIGNTA